MRESERPLNERLSILDRPRADADVLARPLPMDGRIDMASIRLAIAAGDRRFYIARGVDGDDLYQMFFDSSGGGASGGPRSVLVSHGAAVGWSSNQHRCVVHGVVPDSVLSVRIGNVEAQVVNNAFLADVPAPGGQVVLTAADGDHVVPLPLLRPIAEAATTTPDGRGYIGLVEYGWSGISKVAIDDLDVPDWHGDMSGVLLVSSGTPDVWRVGVVLLEGPRAGELAMADLVRRNDADGDLSVELVGQSAFGPHPDPPRLPAAAERWRELRRLFEGLDPLS